MLLLSNTLQSEPSTRKDKIMSRTRKITRGVLFSTITAAVLSGAYLEWHPHTAAAAKSAQAAVQMVVPVSIETLAPHKVRVWSEFSGTLTAVDYAEVRPEVSGRITEVRFKGAQYSGSRANRTDARHDTDQNPGDCTAHL